MSRTEKRSDWAISQNDHTRKPSRYGSLGGTGSVEKYDLATLLYISRSMIT